MRVVWNELTPFSHHKSYSHPLFSIKENPNQRLYEMGFIKGAVFKIVKKVSGMLQLRLNNSSNDVVIREETMKEMKYNGK